MTSEKCVSCGAEIPEGRHVCPVCKELMNGDYDAAINAVFEKLKTEHGDVLKAMFQKVPVEHNGIKYGCISALTIRTRYSHLVAMKTPYLLQCELMSVRARSITNAPLKDIKILWEDKQ